MIKLAILYLCLIISAHQENRQIFVNYAAYQGGQLYKFFHNVNNGYYADIGCYDSIYASNTLNLQTMGWTGINVDANPERLARFIYTKPKENSINFAIGDQDQFVTLYELSEDSSSTVSPKVKDLLKGQKPVIKQIVTPSISMKQLCQRFFNFKPIFLNLNIKGVGEKALQSNDWNNSKCVPQIIFSQISQQAIQLGLPLPQTVLQKNGYKKWTTKAGNNQVFIHSSVYQKYSAAYAQGAKLLESKQIVDIGKVALPLAQKLGVKTVLSPHYEPKTDNLFYHFTKPNKFIDILQLNEYSNKISYLQDRPIVILHFHPQKNGIIMKYQKYETSYYEISPNLHYYVLSIRKNNGRILNVFILNHFYNTTEKPKILNLPVTGSGFDSQKQQSLFRNEKVFLSIQNQLKQLNELSTNTKNQQEKNFKQLTQTISANFNKSTKQLQILLKKIQNINVFNQQIKQKTAEKEVRDASLSAKQNLGKLMKMAILLVVVIFIALLVMNVIVYLNYDSEKLVNAEKNSQKYKNKFQPIHDQAVNQSPQAQSPSPI